MRLNCPRYNDIIILTKENAAVFIIGVRNKGGAMEGKRTLGYLTRTILILLICLLTLASCSIGSGGSGDSDTSGGGNSGNGSDNSQAGSGGDSTGGGTQDGSDGTEPEGELFWFEGAEISLLRSNDSGYEWDVNEVFSRVYEITGKYPVYSDPENKGDKKEIIIGNHPNRPASRAAYRKLEEIVDNSDTAGYVIYANSSSIAIAYSSALAYDDAMEEFFSMYGAKEELPVMRGVLASQSYGIDTRIEAIRNEYREVKFKALEEKVGVELADGLRALYRMFGSDWYLWMANLYAPDIGGFYFSNSARDTVGYYPDLESTYQVLDNISWSGAFSHYDIPSGKKAYGVFMQGELGDALASFILNMQSPNDGFFYHPQWGTDITVSRQGRDLNWATMMLSEIGIQPYYDTQNGYKGSREGLVTPVSKRGTALAVSKVVLTASKPYLKSPEAFLEYLKSLDFPNDSYTAGNAVESQAPQIIELDKKLWLSQNPGAKAEQYSVKSPAAGGYIEVFRDYLNSLINPETGFWQVVGPGQDKDGEDDGLTYEGVNGLMKTTSCYKKFGIEFEYALEATESVITVTKYRNDEHDTHVCSIYNPWQSFGHLYEVIDSETKDKVQAMLLEHAPEMLAATVEKIAIHYQPGGGFSYFESTPCNTAQGADVACALSPESDVNAAGIASLGLSAAIFTAIGESFIYPYIPADGDRFVDVISNLGVALKDDIPELPEGDFFASYLEGNRYSFEDSSELPPINIWPENKKPDATVALEDGVLVFTKAQAVGDEVHPADSEEYISVPCTSKPPKNMSGVQCLELDFLAGGLEGKKGSFSRIRIDGGGLRVAINLKVNSAGKICFVNSAGRAYKSTPYLDCDKFYKLRFEFHYNVDGGVVKLFVNNEYAVSLTGLEIVNQSGHTRGFLYMHQGYDGAYVKIDNLFMGYIQREYKEESDVVKGIYDPQKGYYNSQVSTGNIYDYYDIDSEVPAIQIWPDNKIADATIEKENSRLKFTKKKAVGDTVHPDDSEEYFTLGYASSHVPSENPCQIFELDLEVGGLGGKTGSFGKFMLYGGMKKVLIGMSATSDGQIYFIDENGIAIAGTPYLKENRTYKIRIEYYYEEDNAPVKLFINNSFVTELTGLVQGSITTSNKRAFVYLHKNFEGVYMLIDDVFCGYDSIEYAFAESVPLYPKDESGSTEPPTGGEGGGDNTDPPTGGEGGGDNTDPPTGGEGSGDNTDPPTGGEGGGDDTPAEDTSAPFEPGFVSPDSSQDDGNHIADGWVTIG